MVKNGTFFGMMNNVTFSNTKKSSEKLSYAEEMELLKEFEEPINFDELTDSETVFKELEKKYGLKVQNSDTQS